MPPKVALIYPEPDIDKSHRFGYSLTLLYLASSLKNDGFNVSLLDFSVNEYGKKELEPIFSEAGYAVIEIDAFPLKRSSNTRNAARLAWIIKEDFPHTAIIAIGKHCSLINRPVTYADFTIAGEPENCLPEVMKSIKEDARERPFINVGLIEDLNTLPFPDRKELTYEQICGKTLKEKPHLAPSAVMETSRGCFGTCSFCQRKGWGRGMRCFSTKRVAEEFLGLLENGIQNIWIADDNFGGNLPRAKEVLAEMSGVRSGMPVKIVLSTWGHVDEEFLELAKGAGVSVISFGVESASPRMLKFYKKRLNLSRFQQLVSVADRLGIYTIGNFIVGAPQENEESVEQSIAFAETSGLDEVNVKNLDYMLGSDIFDSLPGKLSKDCHHVFASAENGLCDYTANEISAIKDRFVARFRRHREERMKRKLRKFGPPYFVQDFKIFASDRQL